MGRPLVDGARVMAEFWVTATDNHDEATIADCLIAQLDADGRRCTRFREYWFEIEGHRAPYAGWGE